MDDGPLAFNINLGFSPLTLGAEVNLLMNKTHMDLKLLS